MRVHYTLAQPEGPLKQRMLLVGSPLVTTFHWRKLIPELSQLGCMTVMVDLPGFGRSDCCGAAPHNTAMRANILWGILDEVDQATGAPLSLWHLAAHGVSCSAILYMANQHPDSTKSQLHISPVFSLKNASASPAGFIRVYNDTVGSEERFRNAIERFSGFPLDDYVLDRMRRPLLRPGACESFLHMLRSAAEAPAQGMGFCPTMALWGGRDELMDEHALSEMQRLLPDAEKHVLKTAGHFPMETHSKAIRDYLRGWIRYNE